MDKDFIKALGYRALDNRLKRLSDKMMHDTRKFFKLIDMDVEPNWHLVFKLLKENETLTMVEMADQLGYTHPSMVVLLKKMTAKGYLTSETDPDDKRKQNVRLTQKSLDLMPQLEQIWDSCEHALYELLQEDLAILANLDHIEASLKAKPLNERFYEAYHQTE
ncbi:MarR family winged helix-turn-helix transcriptional regulator [Robiginitalea sp. SC105]|uniref:MarR family winged helix-turn-helix transcriptional regulator n=1 Tax=Robiginitalea sp. SC105 TaxID=2762332 RepID=UPI001639A2FD|nr:MarR family transcriptional regulator [Robiginitalea sp. SC105]MBC2838615.1 MarR family transcriptional regulator [Robiginitalea sp. SC105]